MKKVTFLHPSTRKGRGVFWQKKMGNLNLGILFHSNLKTDCSIGFTTPKNPQL